MSRLKRWQLAIIVALSVGFIVALYTVAEFGRAKLSQAAADVQRAHEQWIRVVELEQMVMDAESGHRGFLLTGDARHLAPLTAAVEHIDALAGELAAVYQDRDARVAAIVQRLRSHAVDQAGRHERFGGALPVGGARRGAGTVGLRRRAAGHDAFP